MRRLIELLAITTMALTGACGTVSAPAACEDDDAIGTACTAGEGVCAADGVFVCGDDGTLQCDATPGTPAAEDSRDGTDDDCDGQIDEGCAFLSCADALAAGETQDGVYALSPDGGDPVDVFCDQTTDGGGWTLVGSTRAVPLADQASGHYPDLATLDPGSTNAGVWNGLRGLGERFDVRVACRAQPGPADAPFDVDLTFVDVPWYTEWTTGSDADSCFSEGDGAGVDPLPARKNNLNGLIRHTVQPYRAGFLEGEDTCDDADDFTVDLDDRGMGGNPEDGTDWGVADGVSKCGVAGLVDGQWFVFARPASPTPQVRTLVVGVPSVVASLEAAGIPTVTSGYDPTLPELLDPNDFDVLLIGRYAFQWQVMTPELLDAIEAFSRGGGHVITEWDGISVFLSGYDSTFRFSVDARGPLSWFQGRVGAGDQLATATPISLSSPADPLFEGVPNPMVGGGATEFFFVAYDTVPDELEVLATFEGNGSVAFPAGTHPAILRGRRCGGNVILAPFDWSDSPNEPAVAPLVRNLVFAATYDPQGAVVDVCPNQP